MPSAPPPAPIDPATLAAHADAIRRLARTLVHDDATADDVAQETMRVGLEHPPRAGFPPFAWLAGIARNVARTLRRGARRRTLREAAAARADRVPPTADAVVRLAERRRVVDAVLALAEPYRATIAMRYFDGLPPREIARRSGVPVETVRTRTKRGLELLREELDRRHGGDRRAWMVALLPLVDGASVVGVASLLGGLLMTAKVKGALAAGLLVLLAFGASLALRPSPAPDGSAVAGPPGVATPDGTASTLAARPADPTAPAPSSGRPSSASVGPTEVRGHVRTLDGVPIAGARVFVRARDAVGTTDGPPAASSGPDGLFVLTIGADDALVVVAATADGFAPTTADARAQMAIDLRLAPERRLGVIVVDAATRAPIAGARVESVGVCDGFERVAAATTDARGSADVADPRGPVRDAFAPVAVSARADGYRGRRVLGSDALPRPSARAPRLEFALERAEGTAIRVVHPDGVTPAAGVRVRGWAGGAGPIAVGTAWRVLEHQFATLGEATTAADGTAVLDAAQADAQVWLAAEAEGLRAVRCVRERPATTTPWVLVLRPVLGISGTTVDAAGRPVVGAEVHAEWRRELAGRRGAGDETPAAFPPTPLIDRWRTFSDDEGRFRVEGTLAADGSGTVSLWAIAAGYDFAKAEVARPADGAAAAPTTLLLPDRAGHVTVRVRDEAGRPIAGAVVGRPRCFPMSRTDAAGSTRFDLTAFPPADPKWLRVSAAGFETTWADGERGTATAPLEIVLARARALEVRVVDAAGRPVEAEVVVGPAAPGAAEPRFWSAHQDEHPWLAGVWSGPEGVLRFDRLPPRAVLVLAREARVPENAASATVAPTTSAVELRLPRAREDVEALASVEGELVDHDGAPIARISVGLANERHAYAGTVSGHRFRFDDVVPGTYELSASGGTTGVAVERTLVLAPGQEVRDLRLVQPAPASLRGSLARADGGPLGRLRVAAVRTDGEGRGVRRSAAVDAGGRFTLDFTLDGLAPGAYRLLVFADDARASTASDEARLRVVDGAFAVDDGQAIERAFDVVPAARLWLRCDDARFADDAQAWTRAGADRSPLSPQAEASRSSYVQVTDAAGHYVWAGSLFRGRHAIATGVVPGAYHVVVNGREHGTFEGDADVPASGDGEVAVVLK